METRQSNGLLGRANRSSFAAFIVATLLLSVILQPFLPTELSFAIIAYRLFVVPVIIITAFFTASEIITYGLFVAGFLLCEYAIGTVFYKDAILVTSYILTLPPYYKAGIVVGGRSEYRAIWPTILLVTMAANLVVIGLYLNAIAGGTLAAEVLSKVGRDSEDPLFRFSLGNAIEVPALLGIATVTACTVGLRSKFLTTLSLLANLFAAVISQSRLVILLSLYPVMAIWRRSSMSVRIFGVLLLVLVILSQLKVLGLISGSLINRFQGNDYNSASDRLGIASIMVKRFNWQCMSFGNGIGSSIELMQSENLGSRSMESVLFQLLYEIGLLRIAGIILCMWLYSRKYEIRWKVIYLLVFTQAFMLLPVIGFTPLFVAFSAAICVSKGGIQILISRKQQAASLSIAKAS
ncbi:MAG: hypothetical protein QM760_13655 [Nibricoccus sp.]